MGAIGINFALSVLALERLKLRHNAVWLSLGAPALGQSNLSADWFRFLRYAWTLQFLRLSDKTFSALMLASLVGELFAAGCFLRLIFT
jgi:hypothetical protein